MQPRRRPRQRRRHRSSRPRRCIARPARIIADSVKKRRKRGQINRSDQSGGVDEGLEWDSGVVAGEVGILFQQGENSNGPIWIPEKKNSVVAPLGSDGKGRICEKGKGKLTEVVIKKRVEAAEDGSPVAVCGICLSDDIDKGERGKLDCCDHFFCFGCIVEWSKVESKCPMCKQRFMTIVKSTQPGQPASRSRTIHVPMRDQVQHKKYSLLLKTREMCTASNLILHNHRQKCDVQRLQPSNQPGSLYSRCSKFDQRRLNPAQLKSFEQSTAGLFNLVEFLLSAI